MAWRGVGMDVLHALLHRVASGRIVALNSEFVYEGIAESSPFAATCPEDYCIMATQSTEASQWRQIPAISGPQSGDTSKWLQNPCFLGILGCEGL